jgi:predicted GNAT family N-acyltransferase
MTTHTNKTEIRLRTADWGSDEGLLHRIRQQVFVHEQGVDPDLEWDGKDALCVHVIAYAGEDIKRDAVGTGRLMPDGKIGRMAVLREFRGRGIGGRILLALMDEARARGLQTTYLHAQTHALEFYERFGFIAVGEEFQEAGIPHRKMSCNLTHGDRNEKSEE